MKLEELEWKPLSSQIPHIRFARVGEALFWLVRGRYTIQLDRSEPRLIDIGPLEAQCILLDLLNKKGRRENQPDAL